MNYLKLYEEFDSIPEKIEDIKDVFDELEIEIGKQIKLVVESRHKYLIISLCFPGLVLNKEESYELINRYLINKLERLTKMGFVIKKANFLDRIKSKDTTFTSNGRSYPPREYTILYKDIFIFKDIGKDETTFYIYLYK